MEWVPAVPGKEQVEAWAFAEDLEKRSWDQ
jgi:hypothetical protein